MNHKKHTPWTTWKHNPWKGERLFSDEIGGYFKIRKLQDCKEYCANAEYNGTHWFPVTRAFLTTDEGLRFCVPYIWLIFNSVDKNGQQLSNIRK